jgi:3-isopropylmalate/(R)-2-methylmalate dehydratase small subunit
MKTICGFSRNPDEPDKKTMDAKIRTIESRAIALRGDDIDTDRIIPARFLKCVTFDGLGEHVFEDDRGEAARRDAPHPFDREEYRGAGILVVNKNFGCGSSREHAPQALKRFGIRAVIGESFAEIFFGNCIALGIPCLVLDPEIVRELQDAVQNDPQTLYTLDLSSMTLEGGGRSFEPRLSPVVREQFLSGNWDVTSVLLENAPAVDEVSKTLPYLGW